MYLFKLLGKLLPACDIAWVLKLGVNASDTTLFPNHDHALRWLPSHDEVAAKGVFIGGDQCEKLFLGFFHRQISYVLLLKALVYLGLKLFQVLTFIFMKAEGDAILDVFADFFLL